MTESAKMLMLMRVIEDDSEDAGVLSAYLELAKDKIMGRLYPFKESFEGMKLPEKFDMLQIKVAGYLLNKRGAEGEIQHIENGIHRNYGDADVPESMLKDVIPFAQGIR